MEGYEPQIICEKQICDGLPFICGFILQLIIPHFLKPVCRPRQFVRNLQALC